MIALYMRLSRADGDLEGEGAVSNSIANQRAILRSFVERDPGLSCQPVEEFVDDGFSGSSFDRPEVQRMLALCKEGRVSCIIVKDLSRFAREYIDAGTYIEQVFPFLRVRFVSIAESYDSAACSLDSAAPGIAIRNIANAAYCRDTSIRVRSALQTKWRRGLRPHPTPPFGYMVDPADRMRLAPDERFAPGVRRLFELAAELADPKLVAAALDADGIETPGVAYRRLGLYGYGKRPEPKSRRWTGTQVQKIVGDPVYTGTLVTGKTRRRVMNRHPVDVVPESERYVTEGAHPALVGDGLWRAAQACLRTREHLKGVGKSAPKSPFARGLLRRAECGHSLSYRAWKAGGAFTCKCDCAGGDRRRVTEDEVADAIAAAMREGGSVPRPCAEHEPDRRPKPRVTAAAKLAAYERYAFGKATAADLEVLGSPAAAEPQHAVAPTSLLPSGADRLLEADGEKEQAALLSALEEHRLDDVDRALLRRIVEKVLVREGPRLEVVMR